MGEQMALFEIALTEQEVFDLLEPHMAEALTRSNAGADSISLESRKNYSACCYTKAAPYDPSVPVVSALAFRICCRAGKHYFGVSRAYLQEVPADLQRRIIPSKSSDGFINFDFAPTPEGVAAYAGFLAGVVEELTYSFPSEFDCCSRFKECSDAMQCIHSNPSAATSCSYRKVLRSGRIYYGGNRNI